MLLVMSRAQKAGTADVTATTDTAVRTADAVLAGVAAGTRCRHGVAYKWLGRAKIK
jgi:hypothetical protein